MIKSGSIIIIFCTLFSCNYNCEKKELSKSEKEWFEPYSLGDTVVFESNLLRLDSFVVTNKKNYVQNCNRFEQGIHQPEVLTLMLSRISDFRVGSNDKNIQLDFISSEGKKETYKSFSVYDLGAELNLDSSVTTERITLLNDKRTYETFLFSFELNAESHSTKYIKSFNWSKQYGLLRYTTHTDEVFDRKGK